MNAQCGVILRVRFSLMFNKELIKYHSYIYIIIFKAKVFANSTILFLITQPMWYYFSYLIRAIIICVLGCSDLESFLLGC